MCFIMGMSAGGMLPVVYALMAESMPADKRGWLIVLYGGLGTAGGYLLASGLAALLEPHFTWRILWFSGLPTGALLLVLNRWIPESPRFLLERGRVAEAEEVMRWYSVVVTPGRPDPEPAAELTAPSTSVAPDRSGPWLLALVRAPYLARTMTVGLYGLAWGMVNWGFITFVPTILRDRGLDAGTSAGLLFWSALMAVPGTVLVAWLYGRWSSRKTMILFAFLTASALIAFAIVDPGSGGRASSWVIPLMVVLLVGSGAVISMLLPYAAEVYPTPLRSTGSGAAAGASKLGGVVAPPIAALCLSVTPGFLVLGLAVAAPIAISGLVLALAGIETRDRGLEALAPEPRFGPQ
jgi:putative MFS transporter